jgi:hypothetical protein
VLKGHRVEEKQVEMIEARSGARSEKQGSEGSEEAEEEGEENGFVVGEATKSKMRRRNEIGIRSSVENGYVQVVQVVLVNEVEVPGEAVPVPVWVPAESLAPAPSSSQTHRNQGS